MPRPRKEVEIVGPQYMTDLDIIKAVYSRVADLEFKVARMEKVYVMRRFRSKQKED